MEAETVGSSLPDCLHLSVPSPSFLLSCFRVSSALACCAKAKGDSEEPTFDFTEVSCFLIMTEEFIEDVAPHCNWAWPLEEVGAKS